MDNNMMDNNNMPNMKDGMYMHPDLVKMINNCEATCEHMTHHLNVMKLSSTRLAQASLLRDCSDICGLTARFIARNSYYGKMLASICAEICNACGKECMNFKDEMSQHCADVCFECAKHCKDFAKS